jgi:hypothetical protein
MKLSFRLISVTGVAVALAMMISAPASAAVSVQHSTNLAGYAVTSATGITSFTGSVNMPTVTCPTTGTPGMFGVVELTGNPTYSVDLSWTADCSNGSLVVTAATADFCPSAGGF